MSKICLDFWGSVVFVSLMVGLVLVDKVAISLVVGTVLGHSINLSSLTSR